MYRSSTRLIVASLLALAACSDNTTSPDTQLAPVDATHANVLGIVSISASLPSTAPSNIGDTVRVTLTGKDAQGGLWVLRNTTWASSDNSIASVNGNLLTAQRSGTAVVSTSIWNMNASVSFVVKAATVAATVKNVSVTLASGSILAGSTTQATAVFTDSLGRTMTGQPVTWASSNPAVATVSASGGVIAIAGGSANIVATSGTISGSAALTVTTATAPPPPITGPEVFATLPQTYLNTQMPAAPAAGGKIISVPVGGNLQTALNSALPGDVIEIANGASFTGNFILPNKNTTSTSWIVIRPQTMSGVPAAGVRMTPSVALAARLPIIYSMNNVGAFQTAPGAHHYRLVGLEVSVAASIVNAGLVRLGDDGGNGQTTLASIPHDLVVDRMYIHGTATGTVRRCVALNSASSAVIDSWLSDCHDASQDAQAIAGWNGPGPFKIVNNYLEASGENVMFGGADPGVTNLTPSDIEIRRNHITKPVSWKGKWLVKNLLELKHAQRVLIEGNILENNWQDAQGGSAMVLKTVNQAGACPWCITADITVRSNLIRNVGSGFNIAGSPDNTYQDIHARRLTIVDNVMLGINASTTFAGDGRGVLFSGDPSNVVIAHNTILEPTSSLVAFGPQGTSMANISLRDNLMSGGAYGVKGDATGGGSASLSAYMPGGTFAGNVVVLAYSVGYPTGSFYPTSVASLGLTNLSGGNVQLLSTSPYKGKATDGRDPGADYQALVSTTSGVIVAP
ncbi:MAG: Ig-like domain-containing protein [Gemmatimonadaceae bacterium]